MLKYTFKRGGLTIMVWADSLVKASEIVGSDWKLFMIQK